MAGSASPSVMGFTSQTQAELPAAILLLRLPPRILTRANTIVAIHYISLPLPDQDAPGHLRARENLAGIPELDLAIVTSQRVAFALTKRHQLERLHA